VIGNAVDIGNTSVRRFDGFIFLCGGPLQGPRDGAIGSLRHFAVRAATTSHGAISGRRIIVAEQLTHLLQDRNFSDLVEFERYLAALASCVVIFLESPGAIAELGSFSVLPDLRDKVMVVGEQAHAEPPLSFIQLGPIASLRARNPGSVQIYPWHESVNGTLAPSERRIEECWSSVQEGIEKFARHVVSATRFDSTDLTHQLLLTLDLIDMFSALRQTELRDCLLAFGCNLTSRQTGRNLQLLQSLQLITIRHWGNERFAMCVGNAVGYMTFRHAGERPALFDRARFVSDQLARYERDDPPKAKAIRSFRRDTAPAA
jgi:hypothetical protein